MKVNYLQTQMSFLQLIDYGQDSKWAVITVCYILLEAIQLLRNALVRGRFDQV